MLMLLPDLHIVRELLTQRLGSDFARAAAVNQDNYVSSKVTMPVEVTHVCTDLYTPVDSS